jgi:glycosyltransferase involved in cell wall biosynthesis
MFTYDLRQAVCGLRAEAQPGVLALTNLPTKGADSYSYPPEVVFEIRQQRLSDYRLAAEFVNLSGVEIVSVQHEFGIFGGPEGRYLTEFLEGLRKPVVTTLHTVQREPAAPYRETLVRVAAASDHLVVLNSRAIPILKTVYGVPEEKVTLIHHGVPDVPFVDPNFYKDKFDVEGRLVLLTFGLLSRNKGIELVLEPLPTIVRAHPEVVYIVLGATHPEVRRNDGEEYRLGLALFDLEDPSRMIQRGDEWIFGPSAPYERVGDVGDVVFPCGIVHEPETGALRLYYGAANTSIALAIGNINDLLDWLKGPQRL